MALTAPLGADRDSGAVEPRAPEQRTDPLATGSDHFDYKLNGTVIVAVIRANSEFQAAAPCRVTDLDARSHFVDMYGTPT